MGDVVQHLSQGRLAVLLDEHDVLFPVGSDLPPRPSSRGCRSAPQAAASALEFFFKQLAVGYVHPSQVSVFDGIQFRLRMERSIPRTERLSFCGQQRPAECLAREDPAY